MLLYPAHMHFHFIHKQVIEDCGWSAAQWTFANLDVILVMAYFRTGEGIQGHINAQLWAGLISFVTSMTKQIIIAGDFNISPEEFMTTTMGTIMQVRRNTGMETVTSLQIVSACYFRCCGGNMMKNIYMCC